MTLDDLASWAPALATVVCLSVILMMLFVTVTDVSTNEEIEQTHPPDYTVGGEPALTLPESVVALLAGAVILVVVHFRNANRGGDNDGD